MATARTISDVIYRALRILHVIRADETPQTADLNTGLSVLQDMMAAWATDGLIIPTVIIEYFALAATQATYTVGEGSYYLITDGSGTHLQIDPPGPWDILVQSGVAPSLNTVRPETVLGCYVKDSAGTDHPVQIISEAQYNRIGGKTDAGRPTSTWVSYTSPNITFYMYPVPDTVENFYFYSNKPFIEPTSLSQEVLDNIQIPRSYHKALADNLAVELAPEYGAEISPLTLDAARRGKSALVSGSAARRVNPTWLDIGVNQSRAFTLTDFFAGR